MKSQEQIKDLLDLFTLKYDLPVNTAMQGDPLWLTMRLGVISASNAYKAVAKRSSETRKTYMYDLVSQIMTGLPGDELSNKYVDWGKMHEDSSRAAYELATGNTISEVSFVFKDKTFREGCSPDGLANGKRGVEIKCPYNSTHYIAFLSENKIKPEYQWQYQFSMRVLDCDYFDFVQYDPRVEAKPMKIYTVERCPEKQSVFESEIPQFIEDMDNVLKKLDTSFGQQWINNKIKGR